MKKQFLIAVLMASAIGISPAFAQVTQNQGSSNLNVAGANSESSNDGNKQEISIQSINNATLPSPNIAIPSGQTPFLSTLWSGAANVNPASVELLKRFLDQCPRKYVKGAVPVKGEGFDGRTKMVFNPLAGFTKLKTEVKDINVDTIQVTSSSAFNEQFVCLGTILVFANPDKAAEVDENAIQMDTETFVAEKLGGFKDFALFSYRTSTGVNSGVQSEGKGFGGSAAFAKILGVALGNLGGGIGIQDGMTNQNLQISAIILVTARGDFGSNVAYFDPMKALPGPSEYEAKLLNGWKEAAAQAEKEHVERNFAEAKARAAEAELARLQAVAVAPKTCVVPPAVKKVGVKPVPTCKKGDTLVPIQKVGSVEGKMLHAGAVVEAKVVDMKKEVNTEVANVEKKEISTPASTEVATTEAPATVSETPRSVVEPKEVVFANSASTITEADRSKAQAFVEQRALN